MVDDTLLVEVVVDDTLLVVVVVSPVVVVETPAKRPLRRVVEGATS